MHGALKGKKKATGFVCNKRRTFHIRRGAWKNPSWKKIGRKKKSRARFHNEKKQKKKKKKKRKNKAQ